MRGNLYWRHVSAVCCGMEGAMDGSPCLLLLLAIPTTLASEPEPEPAAVLDDTMISLICGLSVFAVVLTIISLGVIGFFIKVNMGFI